MFQYLITILLRNSGEGTNLWGEIPVRAIKTSEMRNIIEQLPAY